jgi:hypothetical protein
LWGVLSEYAVSKRVGGEMDSSISRSGDKHAPDIDNGICTFDVKFNNYPRGGYRHNNLSEFNADYGVLVLPSEYADSVYIFGFITKAAFLGHYEIKNLGYGARYIVEQNCEAWMDG